MPFSEFSLAIVIIGLTGYCLGNFAKGNSMSLISKQLRAFMTVAESGSIRNASTKLSLTVSPVSRMITDFESYYKQKLFIRKGNGVELTQEGRKLHQTLYPLYIELSQIEDDMRNVNASGRKLNIYHDWGKDWLIYNLLQRIDKEQAYRKITINNLEMCSNVIRQREDSVYLLSREYFLNGCQLLEKLSGPRMVLVTGRNACSFGKDKTLVISEEQLLNPVISDYVNRMRIEGDVKVVRALCNDNLVRQLIHDGKGFGLLPEDYENMSSWKDFIFTPLDSKYKASLNTFIYVPINLKGGSAMELSLREAISRNYTRDVFNKHRQEITKESLI